MTISIRSAGIGDAPVLAETVRQGFETYLSFTPRGWEPPAIEIERSRIAERLLAPDSWCLVAEDDGEPAGHVSFEPAGERLAHLRMLFVREPWWGTGLAGRLLSLAEDAARARGHEAMRLETPAGQARARAFYEREGWETDGVSTWEPMLALDLLEYRRRLA